MTRTPRSTPTPPDPTLPEAGMALIRQQLSSLTDLQREASSRASETLLTVRPLTALLDLLNRPEDQQVQLGQILADSLRMLAASTQATASAVADLTAQGAQLAATMDAMITRLDRIEAQQDRMARAVGAIRCGLDEMTEALFEDPPASAAG